MGHLGRNAALAQTVIVTCLLSPLPGAAQEAVAGGMEVGLSFSEELRHDDGESLARTNLGLSLSSQTRNQTFGFTTSAGLDKLLSNGGDMDTDSPRIGLEYGLENRNTALSFGFSFGRQDIDDRNVVLRGSKG